MPSTNNAPSSETPWSFCFTALDEGASIALAADLARIIKPGDCLALDGSVGLGKSTFARALLRARADDPYLEVPSPTFTLVQTYELGDEDDMLEISHFDLYRISDFEELYEIGLEESWQTGAALIEWPDRAEELLPNDVLWVHFESSSEDDSRKVTLSGAGDWGARLQKICNKRQLLVSAGWAAGVIKPIDSDLSPRLYDRVILTSKENQTAILMDMQPRKPGPLLPDGRKYDLVAHRVTELAPMLSISEGLRAMDLRVPQIYGTDVPNGLMLWEDFGGDTLAKNAENPVAERYVATAQHLAALHNQPQPSVFEGAGGRHHLSRYDRDAYLVELDVFLDHYWPHAKGSLCSETERAQFATLWHPLIETLIASEQVLVLRDVQDPNCFWLSDAPDDKSVGFIDFQDCLIGPAAYDLAALATDARVTISKELEADILSAYLARRDIKGESRDSFHMSYCLCVAQRTMKNLGAFARAADQWNRPSYLAHVPRSLDYLRKTLTHPLLSDLKDWVDQHRLAG